MKEAFLITVDIRGSKQQPQILVGKLPWTARVLIAKFPQNEWTPYQDFLNQSEKVIQSALRSIRKNCPNGIKFRLYAANPTDREAMKFSGRKTTRQEIGYMFIQRFIVQ